MLRVSSKAHRHQNCKTASSSAPDYSGSFALGRNPAAARIPVEIRPMTFPDAFPGPPLPARNITTPAGHVQHRIALQRQYRLRECLVAVNFAEGGFLVHVPPQNTVVGFAGDWHGNVSWFGRAIPALRRAALHQVGDFGIWPGDTAFIDTVEYWAKLAGLTIWVTPGNHDDYDQIDALLSQDATRPAQLSDHVWVLPRGYRWTHTGRTFVSLGGAASADISDRVLGKTWWAQEQILPADVEQTVAGGHADIMISHEAPLRGTAAVTRIRQSNLDGRTADTLASSLTMAERLTEATDAVSPTIHVHGHWHAPDEIQLDSGQRVYSMGIDFQTKNLATLDLTAMHWAWLDDPKLGVWR